jgi:pyridinium-3,5-biscarboxylic acid mononucleotide sulfurtransferase
MTLALDAVRQVIHPLGSALVAFSGGTDSALVLAVASQTLGQRVVALTGVSASLPADELAGAQAVARRLGVRHVLVETSELSDPEYAKNPVNRCYFCKRELYRRCGEVAGELGLAHVLDGFNADDERDHRPGRLAALERGIRSPLAEAGLSKAQVRAAAQELGLSVWDKPPSPCLSSRLPYGTPVTAERLAQIGAAEAALRSLGLREFRVRHHGEVARIELGESELPKLSSPQLRSEIDRAVKAAGYRFVSVDLEPFRSGRLNEGLVALRAGPAPG